MYMCMYKYGDALRDKLCVCVSHVDVSLTFSFAASMFTERHTTLCSSVRHISDEVKNPALQRRKQEIQNNSEMQQHAVTDIKS